jgi:eukaryotic translation initiation factor 2-alpha kinase 4
MNTFANLDKYEIQISHTKSMSKTLLVGLILTSCALVRAAIMDFIPSTLYTEALKILLQTNASPSQRRQLFLEKSLSRNTVDLLEILFEGGWSRHHFF